MTFCPLKGMQNYQTGGSTSKNCVACKLWWYDNSNNHSLMYTLNRKDNSSMKYISIVFILLQTVTFSGNGDVLLNGGPIDTPYIGYGLLIVRKCPFAVSIRFLF